MRKSVILVAAAGLLVACGIGVGIGAVIQSNTSPTTKVAQVAPTVVPPIQAVATEVFTAVPAPTAPPYADIVAQKAKLTTAQFDPYAKSLAGASIDNWTGTTLDVGQKLPSDQYQIEVDITGPKDNVLKNAQVYIDIPKADAQGVGKDRVITFSGTLDHVDCTLICTVEVKDAIYTVGTTPDSLVVKNGALTATLPVLNGDKWVPTPSSPYDTWHTESGTYVFNIDIQQESSHLSGADLKDIGESVVKHSDDCASGAAICNTGAGAWHGWEAVSVIIQPNLGSSRHLTMMVVCLGTQLYSVEVTMDARDFTRGGESMALAIMDSVH